MLAVMRVMQQTETAAAVRPARSGGGLSDEPDNPNPDGNEPEPGGLQPFERMYTTLLEIVWSRSFTGPPAKKRVPRDNRDKLVDVRGFTSSCAYR